MADSELDTASIQAGDPLLAKLDPEQAIAASSLRGPTCIIAGAGTGKTRTITHRIAYGIASGYFSANRVLAPLPYIPETLKVGKTVEMTPGNSAWQVVVTTDTPTVCSIDGLVVKALKKGECSLNIDVNVDTMDRTYRSRSALYFITVN